MFYPFNFDLTTAKLTRLDPPKPYYMFSAVNNFRDARNLLYGSAAKMC